MILTRRQPLPKSFSVDLPGLGLKIGTAHEGSQSILGNPDTKEPNREVEERGWQGWKSSK